MKVNDRPQELITVEDVERIRWRATVQLAALLSRCCAGSASFRSPLAGAYAGAFHSGRVVACGGLPQGNQQTPEKRAGLFRNWPFFNTPLCRAQIAGAVPASGGSLNEG
jgi:hypothetical protein